MNLVKIAAVIETGRYKGMVVSLDDDGITLLHIPGRKPTDEKFIDFHDAIIMNDTLREIFQKEN